jgi:hypothetical protein
MASFEIYVFFPSGKWPLSVALRKVTTSACDAFSALLYIAWLQAARKPPKEDRIQQLISRYTAHMGCALIDGRVISTLQAFVTSLHTHTHTHTHTHSHTSSFPCKVTPDCGNTLKCTMKWRFYWRILTMATPSAPPFHPTGFYIANRCLGSGILLN